MTPSRDEQGIEPRQILTIQHENLIAKPSPEIEVAKDSMRRRQFQFPRMIHIGINNCSSHVRRGYSKCVCTPSIKNHIISITYQLISHRLNSVVENGIDSVYICPNFTLCVTGLDIVMHDASIQQVHMVHQYYKFNRFFFQCRHDSHELDGIAKKLCTARIVAPSLILDENNKPFACLSDVHGVC